VEPINSTLYHATNQSAQAAEQFWENVLTRFGSSGCSIASIDLRPSGNCLVSATTTSAPLEEDCSPLFAEGLVVMNTNDAYNNAQQNLCVSATPHTIHVLTLHPGRRANYQVFFRHLHSPWTASSSIVRDPMPQAAIHASSPL
jgi:hypothetical protein